MLRRLHSFNFLGTVYLQPALISVDIILKNISCFLRSNYEKIAQYCQEKLHVFW